MKLHRVTLKEGVDRPNSRVGTTFFHSEASPGRPGYDIDMKEGLVFITDKKAPHGKEPETVFCHVSNVKQGHPLTKAHVEAAKAAAEAKESADA